MTTFDTLHYAKKLKEAGFSEQQAETQAEALRAVVDENLATKTDLKEVESRLARDIELVRSDLKQSENAVRQEIELLRRDMREMESRLAQEIGQLRSTTEQKTELLRRDMREMESRITLRLGFLVVGAATVLGVLMKLV